MPREVLMQHHGQRFLRSGILCFRRPKRLDQGEAISPGKRTFGNATPARADGKVWDKLQLPHPVSGAA